MVKNPNLFISANWLEMTAVSAEGFRSDQGSAERSPIQKREKSPAISGKVLGSPQSFRASSFYRNHNTQRVVLIGIDGLYTQFA